MNPTPIQWLGIALMVVGALVYAWPKLRALIPKRIAVTSTDSMNDLLDRMGRLAALQADLEARGHADEADMAGTWYSLLRDSVREEAKP